MKSIKLSTCTACAGFAVAERGCYLYEEDKMENRDIPELYNVTSGAMKACLPNDTVADMWHVEEDDNDNNSTEFDDWDYEDFESREYTDMQGETLLEVEPKYHGMADNDE